MSKYGEFAKDLRHLADLFDYSSDLPLPKYPEQSVSFSVYVAEAADVLQAAKSLGVQAKTAHSGHTTAEARLGSVEVKFVHVSDTVMAVHRARMAYARSMPMPSVA